jgi:ADP-ribose pyrophosphatase YjhB (NUDIX family)
MNDGTKCPGGCGATLAELARGEPHRPGCSYTKLGRLEEDVAATWRVIGIDPAEAKRDNCWLAPSVASHIDALKSKLTPTEIEDINTEHARYEAEIAAAWAALGVKPEEAADDPETATLAGAITASLQYERLQRREAEDAIRKHPRLGAVPLVVVDNQIVMGQRWRGPHAGMWILPGGGVEYLEGWRDAAVREFLQETGMRIEIRPDDMPIHVMEIIGRDSHRVCLVVPAKALDPLSVLRPADGELQAVRGFTLDELPIEGCTKPTRDFFVRLGFVRQKGNPQ